MNINLTIRLELPDALTAALHALAAALVPGVTHQPPSPGPISPARTRPAGGSPADVSSLTLPAAEHAPPPVFLGKRRANSSTVNKWTPERIAIMRRDWPTDRTASAIAADVNALPGEYVSATQVGIYAASRLSLKRPPGFRPHADRFVGSVADPAPPELPPLPEALPAPPKLPAPTNGKIYATWAEIAAFADRQKFHFNGDMVPVHQAARRLGLLEIILTEPFGPGSTANTLAEAAE